MSNYWKIIKHQKPGMCVDKFIGITQSICAIVAIWLVRWKTIPKQCLNKELRIILP